MSEVKPEDHIKVTVQYITVPGLYRGGVKRPERGVDHPPPPSSSSEVKERVEL